MRLDDVDLLAVSATVVTLSPRCPSHFLVLFGLHSTGLECGRTLELFACRNCDDLSSRSLSASIFLCDAPFGSTKQPITHHSISGNLRGCAVVSPSAGRNK